MDGDEEKAFLELIAELRECHFNEMYEHFREISHLHVSEGIVVASTIAAMVQAAKAVAKENSDIIGGDYFDACLRDILQGGEGLLVGKRYSD